MISSILPIVIFILPNKPSMTRSLNLILSLKSPIATALSLCSCFVTILRFGPHLTAGKQSLHLLVREKKKRQVSRRAHHQLPKKARNPLRPQSPEDKVAPYNSWLQSPALFDVDFPNAGI